MQLEFTFRNIDSSEAIKGWAQKRFGKVLKHLRDPLSAHVTLSVDKHRHRAEMTVYAYGDVLRAREESGDMYATLDGVMAKIEMVAQRVKEREDDRARQGLTHQQAAAEAARQRHGER